MSNLNVLHNEEATLKYTQQQRIRIFELVAQDHALQDPKVASVALKALDGIDKQTISMKRLSIEQQQADSDKEVALLLAQAAERQTREMGNPFRRKDGVDTNIPTPTDVSLGNHEFTEDELAETSPRTTASKFLDKYREENGLVRDE